MPNQFDRRFLLAMIAGVGAASLLPTAAMAEPVMGDVVLGDEAAPVTVIEYASFTCPHCAAFHVDTWPQFKAEYVDTGKVRFILREVYFDREGLWASMAARCGGADAFYPMADQLMKKQRLWAKAARDNNRDEIRKIGRLNGLSTAQFDACFSDQEYARSLVEAYQRNAAADGVQSTPTFIINGAKHVGNMPFDQLAALVDAAL
jgi:protein-disulfide isomerase